MGFRYTLSGARYYHFKPMFLSYFRDIQFLGFVKGLGVLHRGSCRVCSLVDKPDFHGFPLQNYGKTFIEPLSTPNDPV